jgi:hypothetical protein
MGEAKLRKIIEPNYGKIPKEAESRGMVISPPIEVVGTRLIAKSSNIDAQELRFALLFWDRLVWPSSRAIHFASNQDEQYLESIGILKRPDYTIYGDGATGLAKGQIQAFEDLDSREPGVWAIAQGESSFMWKEGFIQREVGAFVELSRSIPIPKYDVPLAEILEFKQRRRDELLTLRSHLDNFVVGLEKSGDKLDALNRYVAEIDRACANLLCVSSEWQFPFYLSNFKTSFSLNPIKLLGPAAGAWKAMESYGVTLAATAAVVAGAASTLEIKSDFGLRSPRRPKSPYKYAYRIDREL